MGSQSNTPCLALKVIIDTFTSESNRSRHDNSFFLV
jgi:hypothetical protein